MAEILPAELRYGATYPKIINTTSMSKYGNRSIAFIETSDPVWEVPIQVLNMSNSQRHKLEAFISRCRDGRTTIHYTPKHVCLPQAYWGDAGNPLIAAPGTLASINGNTLTINSVGVSLKLMEGDLIGFSIGDYNFISRIVADALAATTSITIKIEPFLPSYIGVGARVIFKSPVMNMRLLPGSYECPDEARPTASFRLIEVPK